MSGRGAKVLYMDYGGLVYSETRSTMLQCTRWLMSLVYGKTQSSVNHASVHMVVDDDDSLQFTAWTRLSTSR